MENSLILTGILTHTSFSAEELVKDHFIRGTCRNVSNINSFGNAESIGFFSNGESTLGFSSGILISTGKVESAGGPNSSTEMTSSFNDNRGDRDLEIFASNVIFDAAGIEFDFVPLGDVVTFKYVFASEEYCEFVGSIFNDLFGFFVSGPGINGPFEDQAINVATLPGTDEYVTINNVNHDNNSDSYVKNELEKDANICRVPFNASHLELIEFDGFTIPLTARIDVIPCETYHIRLVIGDVGDDKLDSAVFLESKSFDLGGEVTVRAEVEGSPEPFAYETCRDGSFVFERTDNTDINEPLDVAFTISPISEATEGIDFMDIPGMITIPAQENTYTLPIEVIADLLIETPERLRLDIQYDCQCLDPVNADLFIADLDTLATTFEEIYVCADQPFTVGPEVTGGAKPYAFLWNTSATGPQLMESVNVPTHFTATVTEACGDTALVIVGVGIQSDPVSILSGDTSICFEDTAFLNLELGGYPPWSITYINDNGEEYSIFNIESSPTLIPVTETGNYQLISFEDAHCVGSVEGSANVSSGAGSFEFTVTAPTCINSSDGQIFVSLLEGIEPITIDWDVPTDDPFLLNNLQAGTYTAIVTNGEGCSAQHKILVPEPTVAQSDCDQFDLFVPNVFSPNEDGVNDWLEYFLTDGHPVERIEHVQVFDRWGSLVHELQDLTPQSNELIWDGKQNDQQMQPGVYFWKIQIQLNSGQSQTFTGDVTILR
jgi:gliding motility-associated-like protein